MTDECDQALSIDDPFHVEGGGVAGNLASLMLTLGIPAGIDSANGFPRLTECIHSKYLIHAQNSSKYI